MGKSLRLALALLLVLAGAAGLALSLASWARPREARSREAQLTVSPATEDLSPTEPATAGERSPLPRGDSLRLVACGDILLARTPGKRAAEHGFRYLFAGARDILDGADLAFANLETPVSYLGAPWPGKPPVVTFRADPESLFGLAWAGFDVVSLANNHMNDYGPRALGETLAFLDLLGVARTGAGMNQEEAHRPAVVEAGGKRFAFLAYAEPIWSARGARPLLSFQKMSRAERAGHGEPLWSRPPDDSDDGSQSFAGIAHAAISDLISDLNRARLELNPDYLFVSVHWGDEHQHYPTTAQRAFGRAAIDAGATAVLGHHPHVLQGVERYGDGIIIYSMGNFVFDMAADATYRSAAFHLSLQGGRVTRLFVEPVTIERYVYAPTRATGKDAESIATDMVRWSAALGTRLELEDGGAVLDLP